MTANPIEVAQAVVDNLQNHDLWFPRVGAGAVEAWARRFAESGLPVEDLLAGVDHARTHHTQVSQARADNRSEPAEPFRPTPDLIVAHAHKARRAVLAQLPAERIAEMDMANHLLQEMGLTPQRAHRLSRDIALSLALGRTAVHDLTDTEMDEFKALVTKAKKAAVTHRDRRRELAEMFRVTDTFSIEKAAS
ncbi:hypothetical protein [Nocardia sp. NPDC060249]|uniref:hypothetical protein n=1 Tax=Nocardia sp. NPDC060249 TaxID=3347082 RepID=UPI00364BB981